MPTSQADAICLNERSAGVEGCQSLLADLQSQASDYADAIRAEVCRIGMSVADQLLPFLDLVCDEGKADNPSARRLFGKPGEAVESVKPEAVIQGRIGNCYFMSAVASLAQVNGKAIVDMIKDNGDGTYTVTFPGAKDEPITVSAPTEDELSRFAAAGPHGTWPAVLEKAYGVYCSKSVSRQSPFQFGRASNSPQEATGGGSMRSAGLAILTGRDVERVSSSSTNEVHAALRAAFKEGRPATAYIHNELGAQFGWADNLTDNAGIPCGHEYSVLNYNPETSTLTIRNPWGRGEPAGNDGKPRDGVNDGVFQMTLEEFKRNFTGLALAGK